MYFENHYKIMLKFTKVAETNPLNFPKNRDFHNHFFVFFFDKMQENHWGYPSLDCFSNFNSLKRNVHLFSELNYLPRP